MLVNAKVHLRKTRGMLGKSERRGGSRDGYEPLATMPEANECRVRNGSKRPSEGIIDTSMVEIKLFI